jgi:hypothetical protein
LLENFSSERNVVVRYLRSKDDRKDMNFFEFLHLNVEMIRSYV